MPAAKPSFPYMRSAHPLAQGLLLGQALHQGAGGKLYNPLNPGDTSDGAMQGSNLVWGKDAYGYVLTHSSADSASFLQHSASRYDFERTDSFSLALLIYVTAIVAGTDRQIVCGNVNSGATRGIFLDLFASGTSNGSIRIVIRSTTSNQIDQWTGANALAANVWNLIVITCTGSSAASGVKLYVNGAAVAWGTVNGDNLTTTAKSGVNWNLGRSGAFTTASNHINTRYGAHYLWNRPLPQTEVAQLASDPFLPVRRPFALAA